MPPMWQLVTPIIVSALRFFRLLRLRRSARRKALHLACLLSCTTTLAAQQPLTLDDVLKQAMRANLDLRASQLRADSARAEVRIARAIPNPVVLVAPQNPYQYSVSVPLDIGPQRVYRVRAGEDGSSAAVSDVRDVERLIRFAVRSAFFDLLLADSVRAVTVDARDIFRDLLAADSARMRSGTVPERNLIASELELAKAEAAVTHANASVRAGRLSLQFLMGSTRPDTGFRVTGSLAAVPLAQLEASADDSIVERRADVQAAHLRTIASTNAKSLSRAQFFPIPSVTLVQQRMEPFPNGQHYALGVGAQLPVGNWFAGERARAGAVLEQSRVAEQRTRVLARTEIAIALDQFHAAAQLARQLNAGLLVKAHGALETTRYAYRAGAISYVDLLDAVRTYGQIRVDAATAGHDYWVSAYAVARALDREIVQQ